MGVFTARSGSPGNPTAAAAAALEARDTAAFESTLSQKLRQQIHGKLDLSGPNVQKLAAALRGARLAKEYSYTQIYELTVDGKPYSIYARKEGEA